MPVIYTFHRKIERIFYDNKQTSDLSHHARLYDGGSTIRQAVESVFCQNIPLELLVIDDGSTDQTSEVLSVYQDRPDFHYLKNPHNIGAAASRNRGVQEAHGQYVAFLDADDWWENGKLLLQLDTLHETGRVLCSTGRELMNYDDGGAEFDVAFSRQQLADYLSVDRKRADRRRLCHLRD